MRLIDADKIEFVLPRTLTEEEKKTYRLVIKKAFENAPTVEAIPIEWIKKRVEPLYWTADGRGVQDVAYWLIDEWHKETDPLRQHG